MSNYIGKVGTSKAQKIRGSLLAKVIDSVVHELVRADVKKKFVRCLKCGEKFLGTTYNRICGSCTTANDRVRSRLERYNLSFNKRNHRGNNEGHPTDYS